MKVLLFGIIAEKANAGELELEAESVSSLKHALEQQIKGLRELSYALAVDRVIVHNDQQLTGSEEIALLPPFAGG
ncbi:MAG: MoaD/ThiS family protein [Flavobacteriales bacterium]|nr:MoaD/ThiS family protein [Flavobacteriales bacterium]